MYNDGESDEIVKANLKRELVQSLDANKLLNQNETLVFRQVLLNDQLEIFSNPRRDVAVLDDKQKNQMLNMMNNQLVYIKNEDAQIRVRIDRSHIPRLNAYIVDNYAKFEKNLEIFAIKRFTFHWTIVMNATASVSHDGGCGPGFVTHSPLVDASVNQFS